MDIISVILFGLSRGIKEGMVMYQPGVREHPAFAVYHLLSVFVFVAFLFAAIAVYEKVYNPFYRWRIEKGKWLYLLVGIPLLLWEFTEIGENIARYNKPFIAYEHINFADIISVNINGAVVYFLHGVRLIAGLSITLIYRR